MVPETSATDSQIGVVSLLVGIALGVGCEPRSPDTEAMEDVAGDAPDGVADDIRETGEVGTDSGVDDANNDTMPPGGPVRQSGEAPWLLEVEAEAFSGRRKAGEHRWQLVGEKEASGGKALQASPVEPHVNVAAGDRSDSPRLEFAVELEKSGPHYVWVRGRSVSGRRGGTNSIHVGVAAGDTSDVASVGFRPEAGYLWSNQLQGTDGRARIEVGRDGRATLRVWMRESGFVVDRIVITPDPGWAPGPEGPTVEMWETESWTVENASHSGNPYDVVSTVTFRHTESDRTRSTEMYYAGGDEWKFRFTGTRTGRWTYESESNDSELDGITGSLRVEATDSGPDRGFLTSKGNKFAVQTQTADVVEPFLWNVYQISSKANVIQWSTGDDLSTYLSQAKSNGCRLIFLGVYNSWFDYGTKTYSGHSSRNPDRETFRVLEHLIRAAHERGMAVHLWAWGDEARKWTPVGVGGQNGKPDRRLQRYIAARLGPLPGWTMGYGFDLEEWANEKEVGRWAKYLNNHFGWSHLLMARGRRHQNLDVVSYSDLGHSYSDAVSNLSSDRSRPHFFEERDLYERESYHTMDWTRRHFWKYAIAGGHGGHWGVSWEENASPYPKPEQLRTFQEFWRGRERFRFPMERHNGLSPDGRVLAAPTQDQYVIYAEDTKSVQVDLSELDSRADAIAVDTTETYNEQRLETVGPGSHTFQLPDASDWAIAVGSFP